MPCFHPIDAWQRGTEKPIFKMPHNFDEYRHIKIGCGQCIGCRLEKAREWAVRCTLESSLYLDNSFLTLTYDDDHLPNNGNLDLEAMQLFFKKLRKAIYPQKIRYLYCGEYGDLGMRPHYHAIIFNYWPRDAKVFKKSHSGELLFRSDTLDRVWSNGYVLVGNVSFDSASYVARYTLKKKNADNNIYRTSDSITGEPILLHPPFVRASNRPGIGAPWSQNYFQEVINHEYRINFASRSGVSSCGLPRYFRKILKFS